jgi:hypothetical protein
MSAATRQPYPFKGQKNWFYKRIEPQAFHLNEVLFSLKSDRALRLGFLADPEGFGAEHRLDPDAVAALRDRDIHRLNAAGGHPIVGWTVILLLRMDSGDTHGPAPGRAASE